MDGSRINLENAGIQEVSRLHSAPTGTEVPPELAEQNVRSVHAGERNE